MILKVRVITEKPDRRKRNEGVNDCSPLHSSLFLTLAENP